MIVRRRAAPHEPAAVRRHVADRRTGRAATIRRSPFDAEASGIVPGEGVGVRGAQAAVATRAATATIFTPSFAASARATSNRSEAAMQLAIERAFEDRRASIRPTSALIEMDGTGIAGQRPGADSRHRRRLRQRRSARNRCLSAPSPARSATRWARSAMASFLKASLEVENGQMPATFGLKTAAAEPGRRTRQVLHDRDRRPLPDHARRRAMDDGLPLSARSARDWRTTSCWSAAKKCPSHRSAEVSRAAASREPPAATRRLAASAVTRRRTAGDSPTAWRIFRWRRHARRAGGK